MSSDDCPRCARFFKQRAEWAELTESDIVRAKEAEHAAMHELWLKELDEAQAYLRVLEQAQAEADAKGERVEVALVIVREDETLGTHVIDVHPSTERQAR